jgi:hypothetical protein
MNDWLIDAGESPTFTFFPSIRFQDRQEGSIKIQTDLTAFTTCARAQASTSTSTFSGRGEERKLGTLDARIHSWLQPWL